MVPAKSPDYDYDYDYEVDPNQVPATEGAQADDVRRGQADVVQPAEMRAKGDTPPEGSHQ